MHKFTMTIGLKHYLRTTSLLQDDNMEQTIEQVREELKGKLTLRTPEDDLALAKEQEQNDNERLHETSRNSDSSETQSRSRSGQLN